MVCKKFQIKNKNNFMSKCLHYFKKQDKKKSMNIVF